MKILEKIAKVIEVTVKVILVLGFIIFEQVIWEQIIYPVKTWLVSLEIMQKIQAWIETKGTKTTMLIFLIPLFIAEALSIYSGALIATGTIMFGVILYAIKIPVASVTFWIFGFTKEKLLSVKWFKYSYNKTMIGVDWIKSKRVYREVMYSIYKIKKYIKTTKNSEFRDDIEHVYQGLVSIFKGRKAKN